MICVHVCRLAGCLASSKFLGRYWVRYICLSTCYRLLVVSMTLSFAWLSQGSHACNACNKCHEMVILCVY